MCFLWWGDIPRRTTSSPENRKPGGRHGAGNRDRASGRWESVVWGVSEESGGQCCSRLAPNREDPSDSISSSSSWLRGGGGLWHRDRPQTSASRSPGVQRGGRRDSGKGGRLSQRSCVIPLCPFESPEEISAKSTEPNVQARGSILSVNSDDDKDEDDDNDCVLPVHPLTIKKLLWGKALCYIPFFSSPWSVPAMEKKNSEHKSGSCGRTEGDGGRRGAPPHCGKARQRRREGGGLMMMMMMMAMMVERWKGVNSWMLMRNWRKCSCLVLFSSSSWPPHIREPRSWRIWGKKKRNESAETTEVT